MQTLVNGLKLAYTDEGQGIPLVFIHGFPLSRGAWDKQVVAFKSSYRVIVPDLRGLGESATKGGLTPMAHYAEDIHTLLRQLNCNSVVLIGHSMGGYIALPFAERFPEMLRGLVLVGTKAGNDTAETAATRRATADKVKAEGIKGVVEAMASKMLAARNADAAMAAQVRGLMSSSQPDGVIGALLGMAERPDSTAMLSTLRVPTLVVTGADDVLVPPVESEKLAAAIPGAVLKIIPGAGHLVAYEKPEEFNRALKDWLPSLKSEVRTGIPFAAGPAITP